MRIAVPVTLIAGLGLTGLTSVAVAVRPHASPTFVADYRGSDPDGPVSFTLGGAVNEPLNRPPFTTYELYDLKFASECSRSGTKLPGVISLTHHRRHASEQQHFTYRARGFVIHGLLYGPLGKPKFKGTVEVVRHGCDGDVLPWTAKFVP
jgi:hypothetical protein